MVNPFSITYGNAEVRTKVIFNHLGLRAQSSGIWPNRIVLLLKQRMRISVKRNEWFLSLSLFTIVLSFQHLLKLSVLTFAPNSSLSLAFCRSSSVAPARVGKELSPMCWTNATTNSHIMPLSCIDIISASQNMARITNLASIDRKPKAQS